MDMVLVCAYFKKMDLVPIGESYTRLFQNHVHFLGHHYLAIFGRTDEVIDENADIVTFVDVDAHALSIYHPRQAAGNYTLREIKTRHLPSQRSGLSIFKVSKEYSANRFSPLFVNLTVVFPFFTSTISTSFLCFKYDSAFAIFFFGNLF